MRANRAIPRRPSAAITRSTVAGTLCGLFAVVSDIRRTHIDPNRTFDRPVRFSRILSWLGIHTSKSGRLRMAWVCRAGKTHQTTRGSSDSTSPTSTRSACPAMRRSTVSPGTDLWSKSVPAPDTGLAACANEAWISSPTTSWAIEARPHAERAEPVLWTEVLQGGPEVLGGYVERTLLICWPDPWSGFDEVSLLAYPGGRVAVVGEPGEAGPGRPGLRALLQRSWQPIETAPVPCWPGSEDRLTVYGRR